MQFSFWFFWFFLVFFLILFFLILFFSILLFLLFLFFIWTYLFFFVYFLIALVAFFVSPITIFFFFFWHVQLHLSNLSSHRWLLLNFYFFFSNSHVDHHQTLFFSFSFSFSYYFQTRVLQKVKKTEHCRLLIEENSSKIISNSVRWFFCVGFFVWNFKQLFFNWKGLIEKVTIFKKKKSQKKKTIWKNKTTI